MAERPELALDGSVGPTSRSYWIVEGRFAAGAYPGKKGREELDQIPEVTVKVLEAGIDTFVNLTQDCTIEDLSHYDADVGQEATVERFPIVDINPRPTPGRRVWRRTSRREGWSCRGTVPSSLPW